MRVTTTTVVLGKRKEPESLVLRLGSTKRFRCSYDGCGKAYSKPAKLEEHQRAHTGLRPYTCPTCTKSYFRKSHLDAHSRTHLPESARTFVCSESGCQKRFWTNQHLRAHLDLHNGVKPFACPEVNCDESFAKHHQLRAHTCAAHSPSGTKSFICPHTGCGKSFSTNQHLRTHSRVHDDRRYACSVGMCISVNAGAPAYFANWTALQSHIRTAHPPTCRHPSCNGKTFSSRKGLRAHQKIHESRDIETKLGLSVPRRRGGELGRDWKCEKEGCGKDFKSKKALTTHTTVKHEGRRDHVCPHEDCLRAFGYKHLLQRHLLRIHSTSATNEDHASDSTKDEEGDDSGLDIDVLTGRAYVVHAREKLLNPKAVPCLFTQIYERPDVTCEHVFMRVYDLRRHLLAAHQVHIAKEEIEKLAEDYRSSRGG